jgi:hypothetical protein
MTEIEALHTHIQSLQNELKEMTEDKNHFADKSISLAKLLTEKEITISKQHKIITDAHLLVDKYDRLTTSLLKDLKKCSKGYAYLSA